MSHSVSPGSFHSRDGGSRRSRLWSVTAFVRRHGVKGLLAIAVAALFAFAPLALLYWFTAWRLESVSISSSGQRVVVKPGQHKQDQQRDEPGETALLQVICEVPGFDGYRELLGDDDPVRREVRLTDSNYVRRELVYVRRAGQSLLPFGLLGKPPVSVWLPAGDYEVLVVHEAPRVEPTISSRAYTFPWICVFADCSLESRRTTTCRVPLPHYDWGGASSIQLGQGGDSPDELRGENDVLAPLLKACEEVRALPTPAGYLLALDEPSVQHSTDHRHCVVDPRERRAVPREWTRDQLAALRNWLPQDAQAARAKLSQLIDRLRWREFLEGWFCYVAAAISGLVFTRWGAIAMLEPWRRGAAWSESLGLLVKIACVAAGLWLLFSILTD